MTATAFYCCSAPPWRILCAASVPRAAAERWLRDAPEWARLAVRSLSLDGDAPAFLKLRRVQPWRACLAWLATRPSPARREFELALALGEAGVRTARPLACIEEKRGPVTLVTGLLVERLAAPTLRHALLGLAREASDGWVPAPLRRSILQAVAVEVARLHRAGFRQRDLKALNVLIATAADGSHAAVLVDLEGMRRLARPPGASTRVRDLARLAVSLREREVAAAGVSQADWQECLRAYLSAAGLPSADADVARWAAATLEWAARKEARNRRRGRETL